MARLPQPGSDKGTWGEVLNEYLLEAHAADGSLKDIAQSKVAGLISTLAGKANASDIPTTPAQVGAEPAGLSSTTRDSLKTTTVDAKGRRLDSIEVANGFEVRRSRPFQLQAPAIVMPTPPTSTYGKGSGVSAVTVASGGSGYVVGNSVTIAGGTGVVPATLYVSSIGAGGSITGISVSRPGVYSTNPTNPVSQASTTGSGTGATFTVTMNGGVPSGLAGTTTIYGPQSTYLNYFGNGPTTEGGMTYGDNTHCWWEFSTDAAIFDLRFTAYNSSFQVFVNGERLSASAFTTDASGGRYVLTLDFTSRAIRTIRVVGFNMRFVGVLVQSTAQIWKPVEPRRPKAWVLGDSYTFGTGATDTTASANIIMAECLGLDILTDGVGGAGWTGSTSGTPAQRITTKLTPLTHDPEIIFFDLGYNNGASTPNVPAIETGINDAVAAARTIKPNARLIAFGPATPQGSTTNLTTVKNTIIARCTALGVSFIDVEGWITMNNESFYIGVDNVHPTPEGHRYLGERKARAVAALLAS